MSKKVVVKAPANLAFVKYWGRRDEKLILPYNSSISMNLSNCYTVTEVESGDFDDDEVEVEFYGEKRKRLGGKQRERVMNQVRRMRKKFGVRDKVRIKSRNNFPADAGIASSASGLAALTYGLAKVWGLELSEKELSIETRLSGSGSACRSVPEGLVKWQKGERADGSDSFAYSLYPADYWDLRDLVVVVSRFKKKVGSDEGHRRARGEYFEARLAKIEKRVEEVERALQEKDIERLGRVVEHETISLHMVAMLSEPPIYYWNEGTWAVIDRILALREEGVKGYFSMDAGANVHVICEAQEVEKVKRALEEVSEVREIFENKIGKGVQLMEASNE